jgi:hypothetical protein
MLVGDGNDYSKSLAKTQILIATTYYQLELKKESLDYFEKAERLFYLLGHQKNAKEIQKKKEQLLFTK